MNIMEEKDKKIEELENKVKDLEFALKEQTESNKYWIREASKHENRADNLKAIILELVKKL